MDANLLMSKLITAAHFNLLRWKIHSFKSDYNKSADEVINNDDLLNEILLRLPVKSLQKFKLVSKRWQALISNPRFYTNWKYKFDRTQLLLNRFPENKYDFMPLTLSDRVKAAALPYHKQYSGMTVLQSCNGLLLCCSLYTREGFGTDTYYHVCNPATNQIRTLPQLPSDVFHDERYGFGTDSYCHVCLSFDPSKSPNYSVLWFASRESYNSCKLLIYLSETKTWTLYPEVPVVVPLPQDVTSDEVFWNDTILWLDWGSREIFAFDMKQQQFRMLETPLKHLTDQQRAMTRLDYLGQNWGSAYFQYFGESGGHLYCIKPPEPNAVKPKVDVFEMDRDEWKWFVKYSINLDDFVSVLCWKIPRHNKQFVILDVLFFDTGEHDEEPRLVLFVRDQIIAYHLRDNSIRKCGNLKLHSREERMLSVIPGQFCRHYTETILPVSRIHNITQGFMHRANEESLVTRTLFP